MRASVEHSASTPPLALSRNGWVSVSYTPTHTYLSLAPPSHLLTPPNPRPHSKKLPPPDAANPASPDGATPTPVSDAAAAADAPPGCGEALDAATSSSVTLLKHDRRSRSAPHGNPDSILKELEATADKYNGLLRSCKLSRGATGRLPALGTVNPAMEHKLMEELRKRGEASKNASKASAQNAWAEWKEAKDEAMKGVARVSQSAEGGVGSGGSGGSGGGSSIAVRKAAQSEQGNIAWKQWREDKAAQQRDQAKAQKAKDDEWRAKIAVEKEEQRELTKKRISALKRRQRERHGGGGGGLSASMSMASTSLSGGGSMASMTSSMSGVRSITNRKKVMRRLEKLMQVHIIRGEMGGGGVVCVSVRGGGEAKGGREGGATLVQRWCDVGATYVWSPSRSGSYALMRVAVRIVYRFCRVYGSRVVEGGSRSRSKGGGGGGG